MFDISIFRDHAFYMQLFQHLVIISDESGLDHVAEEVAIPTRVTAQVTVNSVILILRKSLSAQ
jgi:hypothetical protein